MFKKYILIILILQISTMVFAQGANEKDVFSTAEKAYQRGAYGVAMDLFKRFIDNSPESKLAFQAKLYIAQCQFQKNDFIRAREILTELEKSPVPADFEDRLLFWLGQVYLKVKDFPKAIAYLKKLIHTYPDSDLFSSAKLQLGRIFFQNGDYNEAVEMFGELYLSKDTAVKEEALFEKGQALYQLKDYNAVLKNYHTFSLVFLDSDKLSKANFYMGEASFYLEDYKGAIEYYSKALDSDEDLIKMMCYLGIGWSYLKTDKLKEAESAFLNIDEFKNQDFNRDSFFLARAILYLKLKNYNEALKYYDKLINSYSDVQLKIHALSGKAECLMNLVRYDEAKKIYLEIIESAKNKNIDYQMIKDILVKAHYNLGMIYLKSGNLDEAVIELQEVVSQTEDPEVKANTLSRIADIYQQAQEFKKAIEIYSTLLKDFPDNSYRDYISYQLGVAYLRAEEFNLAISTFIKFNKDFTQSSFLDDVNYYLGYAYFKNNDYENSSRQLKNFLEVFTNSAYRDNATYFLAASFYNSANYKEAMEKFKDILTDFRQDEELTQKAEYGIADSLYQMGQKPQAVEKFKEFIKSHPKSQLNPNIIFWLGEYYYQNSQFELSRKNFQDVVRMYPGNNLVKEAWYKIGLAFLAESRYDEAMSTFKRFLDICESIPEKAETMLTIADLLLEKDQQTQAQDMYNKLTQLVSSNNIDASKDEQRESGAVVKFVKLAFIRLGDLQKKNNKLKEAISFYRKALAYPLDESHAQIQFKIAECFEEENNLDSAQEAYANITSADPGDKVWVVKGMLRLAGIYEDRLNWQEAINIYEKIIAYNVDESKYAKERLDLIKSRELIERREIP